MNVDEWIRHYLWQGVDHVYLIDNGSDDESYAIALEWSKKAPVTVVRYPEQWLQRPHYWRAIKDLRIRQRSEWLIISDLDEFWFARKNDTIPEAISEYHYLDLIYCNWTVFGSSGFDRHPGSLRRDMIKCFPENPLPHYEDGRKFMVRTECLREMLNLSIHGVVDVCSSAVATDNQALQLNHYIVQSREYFGNVKVPRGDANSKAGGLIRTWDYFDSIDKRCSSEDRTLAHMVIAREQEPSAEDG